MFRPNKTAKQATPTPQAKALISSVARLPLLVLVVGLTLSLAQYRWNTERQDNLEQSTFQKRVSDVTAGLKRRLDGNVQALRGVRGLFMASDDVSRQEFKTYYDNLLINRLYPGIQGVGYSEWLKPAELASFEKKIRAQGFSDFAVKPAGPRSQYSSILYLEPFDWRNQRAFGYDMYSEPTRQKAMHESVENNQPALSGKVTLVQETDQDVQAGLLIYVPVFKKGMPTATSLERWNALKGWTYSPLRVENLVENFLELEFPGLAQRVELRIFASTAQGWGQLLYQSPTHGAVDVALQPVSSVLEIYGNRWLIVATPLDDYWHDDRLTDNYQALLLTGMVLTITVAVFLLILANRNLEVSRALDETSRAKQRLEDNEVSLRLAATVVEASPTGIFVADHEKKLVAVNPSFSQITGFAEQQVIGQDFSLLTDSSSGDGQRIWNDLRQLGVWQGELSFRRPDGNPYPCEVSIKQVVDQATEVVQYVGMFTDISDRRKDEQRIRFLAHHDYLTGLANRASFLDRAQQALLAASRYNLKPLLMFIDLDRFKPINDAHGHEAGDIVLKEIASRLRQAVRESDLVCRLGGDEFVILMPDHQDGEAALAMAQQVLKAIERPYRVGALNLELSASIGLARFPADGVDVESLVASADAAMYQAKGQSQTNVVLASAG